MNQSVLIKHDENLYSDSTVNHENRDLLFYYPEHLQTVITSSSKLQIMFYIYPF
jgi:hypothetical protein